MSEPVNAWVNAPLCDSCWADTNPWREPVRVRDDDPQVCSECGAPTEAGIYVRAQRSLLPFPPEVDDRVE